MRRIFFLQYSLMAAAWAIFLALHKWPRPCADLNGFLGWNGQEDTQYFGGFMFTLPRILYQDWRSASPPVARPSLYHLAWLAAAAIGSVLFLFGPTLVRRRNLWSTPGQRVIRILSLSLLALPIAMVAPPSCHLPQPLLGMYFLAAADTLMMIALLLTPKAPTEPPAFPIEPNSPATNK